MSDRFFVTCRLVDVLLGSVVQVQVDEKVTENDPFDDLSTIDVDGRRERTQFKHSSPAEILAEGADDFAERDF